MVQGVSQMQRILAVSLLWVLTTACSSSWRSDDRGIGIGATAYPVISTTAATPLPIPTVAKQTDLDPHHHVVDVTTAGPGGIAEFASDFQMVEALANPSLDQYDSTENPARTYRVFYTYEFKQYEYSRYRLFVEDFEASKTYEITGLPLEWRPFSDFIWVTNDILVFDRWGSPHTGVHYAIDVRSQKVILASAMYDQMWIDMHKP